MPLKGRFIGQKRVEDVFQILTAGWKHQRRCVNSFSRLRSFLIHSSNPLQPLVRRGGQFDPQGVARPHLARGDDDAHDAGLADEIALRVAVENRRHQSGTIRVELPARIAQPGDLDDGRGADAKPRSARQVEQRKPARQDVLSDAARHDPESGGIELVENLFVKQMHLAQVGLRRILGDARAVLDGRSEVRVALNAEALEQPDALLHVLAEPVRLAAAHRDDETRLRQNHARPPAQWPRRASKSGPAPSGRP